MDNLTYKAAKVECSKRNLPVKKTFDVTKQILKLCAESIDCFDNPRDISPREVMNFKDLFLSYLHSVDYKNKKDQLFDALIPIIDTDMVNSLISTAFNSFDQFMYHGTKLRDLLVTVYFTEDAKNADLKTLLKKLQLCRTRFYEDKEASTLLFGCYLWDGANKAGLVRT